MNDRTADAGNARAAWRAPRGYHYVFGALLARQQWTLDTRQRSLAEAQRKRTAAERALHELQRLRTQLQNAAAGAGARFDPARAHGRLVYLLQLSTRIDTARAKADALARDCDHAVRECAEAQARLEAFEHHRREHRARFVQREQRLDASRADHDWLARHAQGGTQE